MEINGIFVYADISLAFRFNKYAQAYTVVSLNLKTGFGFFRKKFTRWFGQKRRKRIYVKITTFNLPKESWHWGRLRSTAVTAAAIFVTSTKSTMDPEGSARNSCNCWPLYTRWKIWDMRIFVKYTIQLGYAKLLWLIQAELKILIIRQRCFAQSRANK